MARVQVMVQLTDEIVKLLDEEAEVHHVSRSAVIRDVLDRYLADRHSVAVGRAIVEGYRKIPPVTPDGWGDLHAHGEQSTRELLQRLDAEESAGGHAPW